MVHPITVAYGYGNTSNEVRIPGLHSSRNRGKRGLHQIQSDTRVTGDMWLHSFWWGSFSSCGFVGKTLTMENDGIQKTLHASWICECVGNSGDLDSPAFGANKVAGYMPQKCEKREVGEFDALCFWMLSGKPKANSSREMDECIEISPIPELLCAMAWVLLRRRRSFSYALAGQLLLKHRRHSVHCIRAKRRVLQFWGMVARSAQVTPWSCAQKIGDW